MTIAPVDRKITTDTENAASFGDTVQAVKSSAHANIIIIEDIVCGVAPDASASIIIDDISAGRQPTTQDSPLAFIGTTDIINM